MSDPGLPTPGACLMPIIGTHFLSQSSAQDKAYSPTLQVEKDTDLGEIVKFSVFMEE